MSTYFFIAPKDKHILNFRKFPMRHFFITKKTQRGTKSTKLDVDDASLCVLCVLVFFLCDKKMSL
jgi:hypothetical protein